MSGLKIEGFTKAAKLLEGIQVEKALEETVNQVALFQINRATELIKERIYDAPPKPKFYKRTGNALGGRIIKPISKLRKEIVEDARIKGARKNYLPFLNKNTSSLLARIAPEFLKKFNSKYWDDSVEDTQEFSKEELKKNFNNEVKISIRKS